MKKNNDFFVSQSRKDAYDLIDKYIKEKVYLLFFIGESGVGKSKFLKHLTEHIQSIDVVIMDQFYENPTIFFKALIENLNLNTESYSKQDMINIIAQYSVDKIAENKKLILIIDDISGISEEIIKDISKLYEFEYNNAKILNIILTGDNKNFQIIKEWQEKYFRFVSSSVVYLNPFNKTETITFLKNACEKYNIDISDFSEDNYNEVYLYTEGIPDRIIKIAELLHSFDITGKITIQDIRTIIKSTNIIKSQHRKNKFFKSPYILVFGLIFLVILGFIITTTYMKNELNIVTDIKSKEINLTPIDNKPLHAEIEDNKTDTDNISGTISVKTEAGKVELPKKPVKKCIKLKANLKLRELPTQESPFKTVIPKGKQFTIIEKKGHWAKVNFGSETGWVKATTNLVKEFECN